VLNIRSERGHFRVSGGRLQITGESQCGSSIFSGVFPFMLLISAVG
jgi:hypothetical protein